MDSMIIGRYLPLNSFIHKRDPRLKIGLLLLFLIAVFFDAGFIGYGIWRLKADCLHSDSSSLDYLYDNSSNSLYKAIRLNTWFRKTLWSTQEGWFSNS